MFSIRIDDSCIIQKYFAFKIRFYIKIPFFVPCVLIGINFSGTCLFFVKYFDVTLTIKQIKSGCLVEMNIGHDRFIVKGMN